MSSKFESALLESGDIMRRGRSMLVDNMGKMIAAITAVLAVLLTFTDITLLDFSAASFSSQLAMMLICSYVIYFSLEDAGEKLGRTTELFHNAEEEFESVRGRISGDMLGELRAFCLNYSKEEFEYRRSVALLSAGITEEEFEQYLLGRSFPKNAHAFSKIAKMKPIGITPTALLEGGERTESCDFKNPAQNKLARMIIRLLPSTLCMLLTVSMIVTAKSDLGVGEVIEGIVKLSTLPLIGLRGYSQGYEYVRESLVPWIRLKTDLLDAFLVSKNENNSLQNSLIAE